MRRVTEADIVIGSMFPTLPETFKGYQTRLTIYTDSDEPPLREEFVIPPLSVAWFLLTPSHNQHYEHKAKIMDLEPFQRKLIERTSGMDRKLIVTFTFLIVCGGRRLVLPIRDKRVHLH